ncbi:MAG TPA: glycogen synthase GlgA [Bryobacteraceae bacterium]|nr:glycogen synthase GlgA [Bryobacteraceae bacterium]
MAATIGTVAKILMVGSEALPFVKSGGLGHVLGALPKALAGLGHQVAVVLPRYRSLIAGDLTVAQERLGFALGRSEFSARILSQRRNDVTYFFVQIPELYDRTGVYGENGGDYPDNHVRFGALCRAALGIAHQLFVPDVVHCHDWQAGLLPALVRQVYRGHAAYQDLKLIFTIHNLGYQGLFPAAALEGLSLPPRLAALDSLGLHGSISLLKSGLLYSDLLTTVSPRYADEIQTPEFGFGLEDLLRRRQADLTGILNGADYTEWNPLTDGKIAARYDRERLAGKRECKRALLREMGLPADLENKPLIGIVSRFASQKGFDLVAQIPHEVAAEDLALVVHGDGDRATEDFFRWFAAMYPRKVAVRVGFHDGLAHRIHSGSDMLLVPSRYEPCGLAQIHSLRYGTLPLVRATGGLDDTIDGDTGFKFWGYTSSELLDCLRAALRIYGSPRWNEMQQAAMSRDFSWDGSARLYSEQYRRLFASNYC